MRSSYSADDVEILLKDISGLVEPLPSSIREKKIQSGTHYCEMLPLEYKPSPKYIETYYQALENYGRITAGAVCALAEKCYALKGEDLVLVSLARAGIPIGILLKRYLKYKYGISVKHYAISIIRGRGIDRNAMEYILERHNPGHIQFVDGWVGKGAILDELKDALQPYPGLDISLGVLSDPAYRTSLCGTHEDILIPSSCLNATVTGLISRTFLRDDIIGKDDFHGAAYYANLEKEDLSEEFLHEIEKYFVLEDNLPCLPTGSRKAYNGLTVVKDVAKEYGIDNINLIKPGIGETTRVLLRRIPWKIIVNPEFINCNELIHIYQLADEKGVVCEESRVPLGNYKVCGLIKKIVDC